MPVNAVVARIGRLRIQSAADATIFRQWTVTAVSRDTAAGASVDVTINMTTGGPTPPSVPDTLTLRFVNDGGVLIRSYTLTPGNTTSSVTFHLTSDGTATGSPRFGTVEMVLRATQTTYDVETDGAPDAPPAGFASVLDRGFIRGTTTVVHAASNIAFGGAKNLPFAYTSPPSVGGNGGDEIFHRLTFGGGAHGAYTAQQIVVGIRRPDDTTLATASFSSFSGNATLDLSFGRIVDEAFPAALQTYTIRVNAVATGTLAGAAPNATGLGFTEFTAETTDSFTADPQVAIEHLFQKETNVVQTPLRALHDPTFQMLSTETGFIATRLTNARGEGVNNVRLRQPLAPDKSGTSYGVTTDFDTQTIGGEAGWTTFLTWDASKPGGSWTKTVTIQPTSSDIDATTHLLNRTQKHTILVADQRIIRIVSGGPYGAPDEHWRAGIPFQAGLFVVRGGTRTRLTPDMEADGVTPKAFVAIGRLQAAGANAGLAEFLDPDGVTWVPITSDTQAYPMHRCVETRAGSRVYLKVFTDTSAWGSYDIFVLGEFYFQGVPLGASDKEIGVGKRNTHAGAAFDLKLGPLVARS